MLLCCCRVGSQMVMLLPRLRITDGVSYSGSSFASHFSTLYGVAWCEGGVDRAGLEEEEFDEDKCVLLGCQRAEAGADGGEEGGISNLGALLWMSSTTAERVRPETPQKRMRPSLCHVFLRPTRLSVLFMSALYYT